MAANLHELQEVYPPETLEQVKDCFDTLNKLGFFDKLVQLNNFRLVTGFDTPDESELARQIREARFENRVYITLQSLFPPQKEN